MQRPVKPPNAMLLLLGPLSLAPLCMLTSTVGGASAPVYAVEDHGNRVQASKAGCAMQVSLEEGALVCPLDGRRFSVVNGVPNLLLDEHEC